MMPKCDVWYGRVAFMMNFQYFTLRTQRAMKCISTYFCI